MREVAWVVFDEIHYMRDKGIVYEVICSEREYSIQAFFLQSSSNKPRRGFISILKSQVNL